MIIIIVIISIIMYFVIMALCIRIFKAVWNLDVYDITFIAAVWPITLPIFLAVFLFSWIAGID